MDLPPTLLERIYFICCSSGAYVTELLPCGPSKDKDRRQVAPSGRVGYAYFPDKRNTDRKYLVKNWQSSSSSQKSPSPSDKSKSPKETSSGGMKNGQSAAYENNQFDSQSDGLNTRTGERQRLVNPPGSVGVHVQPRGARGVIHQHGATRNGNGNGERSGEKSAENSETGMTSSSANGGNSNGMSNYTYQGGAGDGNMDMTISEADSEKKLYDEAMRRLRRRKWIITLIVSAAVASTVYYGYYWYVKSFSSFFSLTTLSADSEKKLYGETMMRLSDSRLSLS